MNQINYPVQVLRDGFVKRVKKNKSYSLRAYARYLNMPSSALSAILKDKRGIPLKAADSLAEKLGLPPREKKKFIASIAQRRKIGVPDILHKYVTPLEEDFLILDEQNHYRIIAENDFFTFITLMDTVDFKHDRAWVAKRLGLTRAKVDDVIETLKATKLIEEKSGKFIKIENEISTTKDVPSSALRAAHKEALELAVEKLETVAVEDRYYGLTTVAVSKERMSEAKELIRIFRRKLAALLEEGSKTEVYNLCIQLYPMTEKLEKPKGETR